MSTNPLEKNTDTQEAIERPLAAFFIDTEKFHENYTSLMPLGYGQIVEIKSDGKNTNTSLVLDARDSGNGRYVWQITDAARTGLGKEILGNVGSWSESVVIWQINASVNEVIGSRASVNRQGAITKIEELAVEDLIEAVDYIIQLTDSKEAVIEAQDRYTDKYNALSNLNQFTKKFPRVAAGEVEASPFGNRRVDEYSRLQQSALSAGFLAIQPRNIN